MSHNEQGADERPALMSRGWWQQVGQSFWLSGKDLFTDGGMQWAASVAFYTLLSVFPLLLVAVTSASFFVPPEWMIEQITRVMGELLPAGEDQVEQVVEEAYGARGGIGLASILFLLWSGTRVFGALTIALNIAFDVKETYPFQKRFLFEIGHLLTLGLFFTLAVASRYLIGWVWSEVGIVSEEAVLLLRIVPGVLSGLLIVAAFFLIYRFVPRRRPSWKAALPGAVVAALLFAAARPLFLMYVQDVAEYSLIYGSIAIVIILIFWVWIAAMILLFGAEFASHIQAILLKGMTPEEVERRHRMRSPIKSRPEDDPDQPSWKEDEHGGAPEPASVEER